MRGFERTTLRDIATLAEVGLGTLFSYAKDKRDLTFLLFNDDLSRLVDESIVAAARKAQLLDQVMVTWELHYRFFAQDVTLSRVLLRDMYFYVNGSEAERFHEITARLHEHLMTLVERGQQDGQITRAASSADISALLFSLFASSVRSWMIEDTPVVEEGLATLRRRLRLMLRAVVPTHARAATPQRSSTRGRAARTPEGTGHTTRVVAPRRRQ